MGSWEVPPLHMGCMPSDPLGCCSPSLGELARSANSHHHGHDPPLLPKFHPFLSYPVLPPYLSPAGESVKSRSILPSLSRESTFLLLNLRLRRDMLEWSGGLWFSWLGVVETVVGPSLPRNIRFYTNLVAIWREIQHCHKTIQKHYKSSIKIQNEDIQSGNYFRGSLALLKLWLIIIKPYGIW